MAKSSMSDALRKRSSQWREIVLICGKCSKRARGGFGENKRTKLGKALRQTLGVAKGRKGVIGFVETRCLGLCPKDGVTVALGSQPATLYVATRGGATDVIAEELDLRRFIDPPQT